MISKTGLKLEHFVPVEPTKKPVTYVNLRTMELARYEEGRTARAELAEEIRLAITTQGFFTLINHGVSEDDITRQVDISHHTFSNTPQQEKEKLKAPILEEGSYHGFKLRGHLRSGPGVCDKVENFNVYRDISLREQQSTMLPFKDEVQAFID